MRDPDAEYIEPLEYFEQQDIRHEEVEQDVLEAIQDPESADLDDYETVDVTLDVQREDKEKYAVTTLDEENGIILVESYTSFWSKGKTDNANFYHLVLHGEDEGKNLFYDGNGYQETMNNLPQDAVEEVPVELEMQRKRENTEFDREEMVKAFGQESNSTDMESRFT